MSCTCMDVYKVVCAFIGEDHNSASADPIKRRMPALISAAAMNLRERDTLYRVTVLGEAVTDAGSVNIADLSENAPVCDRLIPVLAMNCAAMAVRDENPELAKAFAGDYTRTVGEISQAIPASAGRVIDVYGI